MGITSEVKAELGRRVAIATTDEFLEQRIRPFFTPAFDRQRSGPADGTLRTRVVQLDSTGAATVEVRPDGDAAVFAKFFPPGTEGRAIYAKLLSLREAGLGDGSDYQVVEPLGYLPELDLLICREAAGPSVADVLDTGDEAASLDAIRRGARALGRLHSVPVRIGTPHSLLVSTEILSLTRRLAKVVIDRPDYEPEAQVMITQLERLAMDTVDGLAVPEPRPVPADPRLPGRRPRGRHHHHRPRPFEAVRPGPRHGRVPAPPPAEPHRGGPDRRSSSSRATNTFMGVPSTRSPTHGRGRPTCGSTGPATSSTP